MDDKGPAEAVVSPAAPEAKKASAEDEKKAAQRARRVMRELKAAQQLQESRPDPLFTVELVDDNLFEWHVRLHQVDKESDLAKSLKSLQIPHILLHLVFPDNFPFAPPFMRVVEPAIMGGHIMHDGAICMDLLTPSGWTAAYTVEALMLQFTTLLVEGRARVVSREAKNYSLASAEATMEGITQSHGWYKPEESS
ncbi:ubiquitin-conjugating enzyme domain-containing protein [Phthorimaea operculella]|nr:ubiquitin-conjugating enzyme domain-containing protein [Phthorimaea operculella]